VAGRIEDIDVIYDKEDPYYVDSDENEWRWRRVAGNQMRRKKRDV
jgi:hypothetical protein